MAYAQKEHLSEPKYSLFTTIPSPEFPLVEMLLLQQQRLPHQ